MRMFGFTSVKIVGSMEPTVGMLALGQSLAAVCTSVRAVFLLADFDVLEHGLALAIRKRTAPS
jgi:hypothetical protein